MPNIQSDITALIENFASQLVTATEAAAAERIQAALASAFGGATKHGPGRRKQMAAPLSASAKQGRPKQLCPVPGCKNPAAPVFGMVCAQHKNVSKAKIKKYREERKAKGAEPSAPKAGKARKPMKMSPKLARARKLQGQYLGALRGLVDADKAKVKQVAKDKGVPEALKLATSLKAARK
jgi:hypothetical protein